MPLCAPVPGITSRSRSELSPATGSSSHSMSAKSPGCPPHCHPWRPFPAYPLPTRFRRMACAVLGHRLKLPWLLRESTLLLGLPAPLPWQEGSGPEPLPSGRLARVAGGGGRGLCILCNLCSHSLDCDSTGRRVPREQSEPGGPTAGETVLLETKQAFQKSGELRAEIPLGVWPC